MKTSCKLLSLLLASIFLFSCGGPSVDREKALSFYASVYKEHKNAITAANALWDHGMQAVTYMELNKEAMADSARVDSLNVSYEKATKELKTAIANLSALQEIDPELNIKQKTLDYLNKNLGYHNTSMPLLIKAITIGYNNLDENDKKALDAFNDSHDGFEKEFAELEKADTEFIDKYNITAEEMEKFGI